MTTLSRVLPLCLLSLLLISCAKKTEQAASSQAAREPAATPAALEHAHVSPGMLRSWMIGLVNRQPSPNAESAVVLGAGLMEVHVPSESKTWTETADVDSNGVAEKVTLMWDGESRIMYAYTRDPVTLADGTTADLGLMIAQFGEDNTRRRVPGSGWYAYVLSRASAGAESASGTLFGCSFDRYGAEEKCGLGTWSREQNEFQIGAVGN